MNIRSWIVVLAIIAIGLGGYLVWSQYLSGSNEPAPEMMKEEPEGLEPEQDDEAEEMMEAETESTETSTTMASAEGPDAERTTLTGVGGFEGSGTATRSFDGTTFIHTARTDGIRDPAAGKFYEGWLVGGSDPTFFSTGKMEKMDGGYELRYEIGEDRSEYPKIFITEETEADGLDGVPEAHILEGSF